jgi:oligopeptide transport system ATP-binding protein
MDDVLLEVKDLIKYFPVRRRTLFSKTSGYVKAIDGVSFVIKKGETLGLVGESGCGKSTTARLILRLIRATSGQILLEGEDVLSLSKEELKVKRKDMQLVFQDPYASLDPRMIVEDIIGESLEAYKIASGKKKEARVKELLEIVGLDPIYAKRYPHEFSGGQRQRIGVARALSLNPKLILCDEPVSALDVSIQAQIINLLQDLQKEFELTYLFIAHDLSVVKHISNRVAVMYLGKIVEVADKRTLYSEPLHPYTQALLSAVPVADPKLHCERILLEGDVPSPINPPSGCRFHTRCAYAKDSCKEAEPPLIEIKPEHYVACHK